MIRLGASGWSETAGLADKLDARDPERLVGDDSPYQVTGLPQIAGMALPPQTGR